MLENTEKDTRHPLDAADGATAETVRTEPEDAASAPASVPEEEPDTPAPAEEPDTPTPAEEPDTPAPAEETDTPAPAEETDTPAPAEETDAPASEEEDLLAVAERITGSRHTIAATAAPIRTRSTGRPASAPRPTAGIPTRTAADPEPPETKPEEKKKKWMPAVLVSAAVLFVLLTAVIVAVNTASEKNRPADLLIGDTTGTEEKNETEETEGEKPDSGSAPAEPETEVPETEIPETDVPETAAPETEVPETAAPETEPPVPETEPEPVKFTVRLDFYDREDIELVTEAITLRNLLEQIGCTLAETDVPSVDLDAMIAADSVIAIDRREYKTDVTTEVIPYETEIIEIDTIPRDTTNYLQYGVNGEKSITYSVEYINGAETSRTQTGETVTLQPVNEMYELGVGGSFVGADGETYTYSHRRVVPATYYNLEGLTYLGTMADESVVAVDMDYIPLGTKLYVKNDTYDFGVRIASDIGGAVDNWEVDIWIDEDNPQLPAFRQVGYHYDMEIYYID